MKEDSALLAAPVPRLPAIVACDQANARAALLTPVGVAVSGFADPQPLPVPGLTVARVTVMVSTTTSSGIVTLGVSEGFADSAGNTMGTAFSLPLLK